MSELSTRDGLVSRVMSGEDVSVALSQFVADVVEPMRRPEQRRNADDYVAGMLQDGLRKSLQPVVERQGGSGARYQSLQQFIADSPWDPVPVLRRVAERVCPQIGVVAWVLDDTGFPKQGRHSPGVKRQYSGTLGKTGNCQVGVSLHAAGSRGTLPLGWSLYLPDEEWCADTEEVRERRWKAKIPDDVGFQTKPELALALAQAVAGWRIPRAPVLGDAAYGDNTQLRTGLHDADLQYVLSVTDTITLYDSDTTFAVPARRGNKGRHPIAHVADRKHQTAAALARAVEPGGWHDVAYRDAATLIERPLVSRFAFLRVTAAHPVRRDRLVPRQEWLIIEWPEHLDEPTDYWLSNLPPDTPHDQLARLARLRWTIELDYKQLKGHLGLDHYEGRSYLGWHHHACLVTVAHAWLTEQRLNPFHPRPD